ncbi:hypothetical protein AFCA_013361 [Aspergillus flavus]|nr:hypothetical protein AFCA_013361 [Aspergillus flavus]
MANIKQEIIVHGNAVQGGKDIEVVPQSDRASITLKNNVRQIQYPIPTPVIVNGQRLKAGKVWIRFSTHDSSDLEISFLKIMDGDKSHIATINERLNGQQKQASYEFGHKEVAWGLNITIGVEYNTGPAVLDIHGIGIDFYV